MMNPGSREAVQSQVYYSLIVSSNLDIFTTCLKKNSKFYFEFVKLLQPFSPVFNKTAILH